MNDTTSSPREVPKDHRKVAAILQWLRAHDLESVASALVEISGFDATFDQESATLDKALDLWFSETAKSKSQEIFSLPRAGKRVQSDPELHIEDQLIGNPTSISWRRVGSNICSEDFVVGVATREVVTFRGVAQCQSYGAISPVLSVDWCNERILVSCMGGEVSILKAETLEPILHLKPHGNSHVHGAFNEPGNFFYTFGRDKTFAVHELVGQAEAVLLHVFRFRKNVTAACWTGEKTLAVCVEDSDTILFLKVDSQAIGRMRGDEYATSHMNMSIKDSSTFCPSSIAAFGDFVAVVTSSTTALLFIIGFDSPIRSYYGCWGGPLDRSTVCFSSDGSHIYLGGGTGNFNVFQTDSEHKVDVIEAHSQCLRSMTSCRWTGRLATVSFDKSIKVFREDVDSIQS